MKCWAGQPERGESGPHCASTLDQCTIGRREFSSIGLGSSIGIFGPDLIVARELKARVASACIALQLHYLTLEGTALRYGRVELILHSKI